MQGEACKNWTVRESSDGPMIVFPCTIRSETQKQRNIHQRKNTPDHPLINLGVPNRLVDEVPVVLDGTENAGVSERERVGRGGTEECA